MNLRRFTILDFAIIIGFIVLLIIVGFIPSLLNNSIYLPIHLFLEMLSIVISFVVFYIGWSTYNDNFPGNLYFLSCLFLVVGFLDFAHLFSYEGMPEFVSPSSPHKAIIFWIAARLIAAITLILFTTMTLKLLKKIHRIYLMIFCIILAGFIYWVGLFHADWVPPTYIQGEGLTFFKRVSELFIICIHFLNLILLFTVNKKNHPFNMKYMTMAVLIMLLTELCFTAYFEVSDNYNVLGHVFKIVAYFHVYRAVFYESIDIPIKLLLQSNFEQKRSNDRMYTTLNSIRDAVIITNDHNQIEYMNNQAKALLRGDLEAIHLTTHDYKIDNFSHHVSPIINEFDQHIGNVHVYRSIEEKIQIEQLQSQLNDSIRKLHIAKEMNQMSYKVFESVSEGILLTDASKNIIYANPMFTKISGYELHELIGKTPHIFRSGWHRREFYERMDEELHSQGFWHGEIWNKREDDSIYLEEISIFTLRDQNHQITNYVAVCRDITEEKQLEAEIEFQSYHDSLTGLPNKVLLLKRMIQAIQYAQNNNRKIAIIYIDIDHFRNINDVYGKQIGDQLLKAVGERLVTSLRASDTIARISGDQLIILLPDIRDTYDCQKIADKIIQHFDKSFIIEGNTLFITTSIGISLYPDGGNDPERLIDLAEQAMYKAKMFGRNNVQFANSM